MPTKLSRSLLVVLIPGLVAVAPWLLALVQHTSATLGFDEYPVMAYALVFACAATAGTFFEGLSTFFEVRWDREREDEYAVKENWYQYLAKCFENEPVGYRYLSRVASTMYFELAMLFAVPVFALGAGLLAALRFPQYGCPIVAGVALSAAGLACYFRWQARCTHRVLCITRREINARTATVSGET